MIFLLYFILFLFYLPSSMQYLGLPVKLATLVESFASHGRVDEQPFYKRKEVFVNTGFPDQRGTQDTLNCFLTRSDPVRWLKYDMPREHYVKCASCKKLLRIQDFVTHHSKLLIVRSTGFEKEYIIDSHVRFSGVAYKLFSIIYRRYHRRTPAVTSPSKDCGFTARFFQEDNVCVYDRLTESLRPLQDVENNMGISFIDNMGFSHMAEFIFYIHIVE
jgi:hypothetical protein